MNVGDNVIFNGHEGLVLEIKEPKCILLCLTLDPSHPYIVCEIKYCIIIETRKEYIN